MWYQLLYSLLLFSWSTNGNAVFCIAVSVIFVYNVAANAVHDIMQLHQANHRPIKRQNIDYQDPNSGQPDQEVKLKIFLLNLTPVKIISKHFRNTTKSLP